MLSIYIHVPFCVKKCLYCGFSSTAYSPELVEAYLAGLRREAEQVKRTLHHDGVQTLYIGGGTPTCLSTEYLTELLRIAREMVPIRQETEWTVEANPQFLSETVLALLRAQGVNRLSIGVQSLDDRHLKTLGRIHSASEAAAAVDQARRAGFRNISVDLIYGIPGQDAASWNETLKHIITLGPEHIAVYALSLDEGSAFKRMADEGALRVPDDDAVAHLYERAVESLTRRGYRQYELSNFSRPGFECSHNMNYWERGEYVGLGPGAWSFRAGMRSCNCADIVQYSGRLSAGLSPREENDVISADEAAREYLMLRLRTSSGLDLSAYRRLHGDGAYGHLMDTISKADPHGLFTMHGDHICLTGRGKLLADQVILQLCA
ncbi:MAG TPA: radical SAM family heme chaperone HemW [Nitrospirota bacterium]|nr:radical SAM family heme chaperone HemW [Nitrospirota bacterium]